MLKLYYLFFIISTEAFSFKPKSNNYFWKLLSDPLKENARNFFIKRAEGKGIPWNNIKNKYKNEDTFKKLNNMFDYVNNKNIKYPDYFIQPFHGYDKGNLNWEAAIENEASTMSISSHYWAGYSASESTNFMRFNFTDKIKNYNNQRIKTILDIGCSIGVSTKFISQAYYDAESIYGVDLSPYFISIAEYNAMINHDPIHFSHQNAENLNFQSNSFDLVTSCFLFHEVPSLPTKNILNEVNRILRKGATFAILDLDPNELKNKLEQNYLRKLFFESTEPHIYEYYNYNLELELKNSGFENIKKLKNDPYNSVWLATKKY